MNMESHFELRRNKPNSACSDNNVISNILDFYGKNELQRQIPSEDEIRHLSGIIDVNAHLLPQKLNGKSCDA